MSDELPLEIDSDSVDEFQRRVMMWWEKNARTLPWREDPTPYRVLISEVMLQQTQVTRVIPKYLEFLEAFPTMESLAKAETKRLLQVWGGLGYNRRAIWLRDAAREIIERGHFPKTAEALCELKGIGPYTSRSILIFAFNRDLAAIDTNIRRVLIASGFANEEMSECQLQAIADQLFIEGRSSDWHNALMDYGSEVLTSSATGIAPTSSQPKFIGSNRQVRGAIIRHLTHTGSLSIDSLNSCLAEEGIHSDNPEAILMQLISEGFVERTANGKFRIAEC
ncbi:MAG: Fe-S cluster assembly protein HesB [Candidatus Thorarchaeota archaeon]